MEVRSTAMEVRNNAMRDRVSCKSLDREFVVAYGGDTVIHMNREYLAVHSLTS